MREKYIEEEFPRYFIFGEYPDGRFDVADPRGDVVSRISGADAKRLIADRDAVVDRLCAVALKFSEVAPEAFNAFWYAFPPKPAS